MALVTICWESLREFVHPVAFIGEIRQVRLRFDGILWKEVMRYSAPLIIVGLGGMVNDVLSRLIYRHVVHLPKVQADHELGVFANIFRIALLITYMIQVWDGVEPFFFQPK